MHSPYKAARDNCLMHGMADTLGIATTVAALPHPQVGALVATCRRCAKPDDCILWMVDHAQGAGMAPEYCLNGETLNQMRRTGV